MWRTRSGPARRPDSRAWFQCPNAGLLRCGSKQKPRPYSAPNCFSALTLGFFDVARPAVDGRVHMDQFQCPNAGLLRCGRLRLRPGFFRQRQFQCPNAGLLRCGAGTPTRTAPSVPRFSALTLGFFDVAPPRPVTPRTWQSFSALTLGFFDVARSGLRPDAD